MDIKSAKQGYTAKEALKAVGLGILFMVVALFVQSLIQNIPVLIFLALHGFNLGLIKNYASLEFRYPLVFSIYLGFIAGAMQEGATYIAVDTENKQLAFFIGIGFSIVDIAILILEIFIGGIIGITEFQLILIILNIISSLLFHPGTATFMKWGRLKGTGRMTLGISIALHTVIDGGVSFSDLFVIKHPYEYHTVSIIFWIIAMSISIGIFVVGLRKIHGISEIEKPEPPVVF